LQRKRKPYALPGTNQVWMSLVRKTESERQTKLLRSCGEHSGFAPADLELFEVECQWGIRWDGTNAKPAVPVPLLCASTFRDFSWRLGSIWSLESRLDIWLEIERTSLWEGQGETDKEIRRDAFSKSSQEIKESNCKVQNRKCMSNKRLR
jgi:hypothetical protein